MRRKQLGYYGILSGAVAQNATSDEALESCLAHTGCELALPAKGLIYELNWRHQLEVSSSPDA
jgi:hypothetical protein